MQQSNINSQHILQEALSVANGLVHICKLMYQDAYLVTKDFLLMGKEAMRTICVQEEAQWGEYAITGLDQTSISQAVERVNAVQSDAIVFEDSDLVVMHSAYYTALLDAMVSEWVASHAPKR